MADLSKTLRRHYNTTVTISSPTYSRTAMGGTNVTAWTVVVNGVRAALQPSGGDTEAVASRESMRIDASGNVLVGTTNSPTALISATSGSGHALGPNALVLTREATTANRPALYINQTGVDGSVAEFSKNGTRVGRITVTGSSTSYVTSSDYRLKNINGPITNSGSYIDSLNPVEGTWKADGSPFVGLIAHEIQEVSRTPVATGEKDGSEMQGMDYSSAEIIANLIAEIQSLRGRVAQLETH